MPTAQGTAAKHWLSPHERWLLTHEHWLPPHERWLLTHEHWLPPHEHWA